MALIVEGAAVAGTLGEVGFSAHWWDHGLVIKPVWRSLTSVYDLRFWRRRFRQLRVLRCRKPRGTQACHGTGTVANATALQAETCPLLCGGIVGPRTHTAMPYLGVFRCNPTLFPVSESDASLFCGVSNRARSGKAAGPEQDHGSGWTIVRKAKRTWLARNRRWSRRPKEGRAVGAKRPARHPKAVTPQPAPKSAIPLPAISPALTYRDALMSKDREGLVCGKNDKPGSKVANPAWVESYRGVADFRIATNTAGMTCTPELAKRMTQVMDAHRDQEDVCCTVRSLLAYCTCDEEFRFVEEQPWSGMTGGEFDSIIKKFAAVRGRSYQLMRLRRECVWDLSVASSGKSCLPKVTVCIAHLALPDDEDDISSYISHAMPMEFYRWHAPCKASCPHPVCFAVRNASRIAGKLDRAIEKAVKRQSEAILEEQMHAADVATSSPVPAAPAPVPEPAALPPSLGLDQVRKTLADMLGPDFDAEKWDSIAPMEAIFRTAFNLPPVGDDSASVLPPRPAEKAAVVKTETEAQADASSAPPPAIATSESGVQVDQEELGFPVTLENPDADRFGNTTSMPHGCNWDAHHECDEGCFREDFALDGTNLFVHDEQVHVAVQVGLPIHVEDPLTVCDPLPLHRFSLAGTFEDANSLKFMRDVTPETGSPPFLNLLVEVIPPRYTQATLSNVRKWGGMTSYFFGEAGHLTMHGRPEYGLTPTSVLSLGGVDYRFKRNDLWGPCWSVAAWNLMPMGIPRTAAARLWAAAKRSFNFLPTPCGQFEIVQSGLARCNDRQAYEFRWTLERQTERDALCATLLAKAQAEALSNPANVHDPQAVAAAARTMRRQYDAVDNVAGVFSWGYCYSCGERSRGKYKGRICKWCEKNHARLAGVVSENGDVCTYAVPVRYPGLVHKPKSHPELKIGAETRAEWGKDIAVHRGRGKHKKLLTRDQAVGLGTVQGRGPTLAGVGLSGTTPFVTAVGAQPLVEAVMYRVFKKLPEDRVVSQPAFDRLAMNARDELLLGRWLESGPVPMSTDEWIASMPSRRRKALQRAHDERQRRGENHPDYELITPFVKQELLPDFKPQDTCGTTFSPVRYVARLIQAPNDETHLDAGKFMKPLVHALKKYWHHQNWLFYGSVAPDKLNHWLNRISGSRSFFWSDYTAFDATFSDSTWDMLEGFYHHLYPDAPQSFRDVLRIWRRPKGRAIVRKQNVVLTYQANTCNCSGRDDTALANALFNGLALSTAFAAALAGVTVEEVTLEHLRVASELCKISIVGDDSLVGCDFDVSLYADAIVAGLKRFGLVVKAEHSPHLHAVTYLGMMPYKVGSHFEWGPTLGRRLYKMMWMRQYSAPTAWCHGVAQSMSLFSNVPLLSDMAKRVCTLLKGHAVTPLEPDENRIWTCPPSDATPWGMETLNWLCQRYHGLTVSMLARDLRVISSIERLPAVVRLESLRLMLAQDDL